MNRWFDLSEQGAKLDRIVDPKGLAYLMLTFEEPFNADDQIGAISRAGWVKGEDGKSLQNFGSFRDLSEIGTVLHPVFGEDKVSGAIAMRERLKQGEVLSGVDRPIQVDMEYVATGVQRMSDHAQSRVMDLVKSARDRLQKKNLQSIGPTGGRFLDVVDQASELTGERPSRVVAKLLPLRNDAQTFDMIASSLADPVEGSKFDVGEFLSSLDGMDDYFAAMEDDLVAVYGEIPNLEQVMISEFLQEQNSSASTLLDLDRVRSDLTEDLSVGVRDTVRGYTFEISPDTTTVVGREMQARLEQMLDFVGDSLCVDASDMLAEKTRFRVVQLTGKAERHGYAAGLQAVDAEGDVEYEAGAVVFKPDRVSVALHEVGHRIDASLGDDEGKYIALFDDTGLREKYAAVVSESQLRTGMSESYKTYLLSNEEMFARLFENAMRQECFDQTGDLDAIGGVTTSGFRASYAPMGQEDLSVFLDAVRDYGQSLGVFEVPDQNRDRVQAINNSTSMSSGM